MKIGVLTVSDRAARGEYEDLGGPAVRQFLTDAFSEPPTFVSRVVEDVREQIEASLIDLSEQEQCSLIVTTGGTGPAPRDVTPDATLAVAERELPGFGEAMRAASLASVPTAVLSRQTACIRGRTLIVNLPGQPRAVAECLAAVIGAIPDCISLLGGPRVELASGPSHAHHAH